MDFRWSYIGSKLKNVVIFKNRVFSVCFFYSVNYLEAKLYTREVIDNLSTNILSPIAPDEVIDKTVKKEPFSKNGKAAHLHNSTL